MGVFASFGTLKYVTKIDENKICRGIRKPPDNEKHTTKNQKKRNAGETEKGWGRMSDMEGAQSSANVDKKQNKLNLHVGGLAKT